MQTYTRVCSTTLSGMGVQPVLSDVGKAVKRDYPPPVFYTPAEHIEVFGDYAEVKV